MFMVYYFLFLPVHEPHSFSGLIQASSWSGILGSSLRLRLRGAMAFRASYLSWLLVIVFPLEEAFSFLSGLLVAPPLSPDFQLSPSLFQ